MNEIKDQELQTGFQQNKILTILTINLSILGQSNTKKIRISNQLILNLSKEAMLYGEEKK